MTKPGPRLDALPVTPCEKQRDVLIEFDPTGEPVPKATQAEHLVPKVVDLGVLDVALFGEPARSS